MSLYHPAIEFYGVDVQSEEDLREFIDNLVQESSDIEDELRHLDNEIEALVDYYESKFQVDY